MRERAANSSIFALISLAVQELGAITLTDRTSASVLWAPWEIHTTTDAVLQWNATRIQIVPMLQSAPALTEFPNAEMLVRRSFAERMPNAEHVTTWAPVSAETDTKAILMTEQLAADLSLSLAIRTWTVLSTHTATEMSADLRVDPTENVV